MGQFSSKTVPCVGVSVGVERVFTVLERRALKQAEELGAGVRESRTQVGATPMLCGALCWLLGSEFRINPVLCTEEGRAEMSMGCSTIHIVL